MPGVREPGETRPERQPPEAPIASGEGPSLRFRPDHLSAFVGLHHFQQPARLLKCRQFGKRGTGSCYWNRADGEEPGFLGVGCGEGPRKRGFDGR